MAETSCEKLLLSHASAEWRSKFLLASDIARFLGGCVLSKDYVIPDDMNKAITLSQHGQQVSRQLLKPKDDTVTAKELRLALFLAGYDDELFIDYSSTDFDLLLGSIAEQISTRRLHIPPRLGREMYDKAADQHDFESTFLTHAETLLLLEDLPTGFSQFGNITLGPLGRVESAESRWLFPERDLPLYHCHKVNCRHVHHAILSTDSEAGVNVANGRLSHHLSGRKTTPTAWRDFEREISLPRTKELSDESTAGLPFLLAECLSTKELQTLVSGLLDNTRGSLRGRLEKSAVVVRDAVDFTATQPRASLIQTALIAKDSEIIGELERRIARGGTEGIVIPSGEIRTLRVNQDAAFGVFDLRPQLGRHGVRFKPRTGVSQLRLNRLIDTLYPPDSTDGDSGEFDWQFRASKAAKRQRRQEEVLRTESPKHLIQQVVLSRRSNVVVACESLGISRDNEMSDDELIDTILWKLGFSLDKPEDVNSDFWANQRSMEALVKSSSAGVGVSDREIRKEASAYFTELERVLDDSLFFAAWTLLVDHLASDEPFHFRPNLDRDAAMRELNTLSLLSSVRMDGRPLELQSRNTLEPLIQGFAVLADIIAKRDDAAVRSLRDEKTLPISTHGSNLRTYPFLHRRIANTLTQESIANIESGLRAAHKRFSQTNAAEVRNSWLHYRREGADRTKLSECLTDVQGGVVLLEDLGLCRSLYLPGFTTIDSHDRMVTQLTPARGRPILVPGPSRLELGGLPPLSDPQYVIPSMHLSEAGDMLRVGLKLESEYSKFWDRYPRRRSPNASSGIASSMPEAGPAATDFPAT